MMHCLPVSWQMFTNCPINQPLNKLQNHEHLTNLAVIGTPKPVASTSHALLRNLLQLFHFARISFYLFASPGYKGDFLESVLLLHVDRCEIAQNQYGGIDVRLLVCCKQL